MKSGLVRPLLALFLESIFAQPRVLGGADEGCKYVVLWQGAVFVFSKIPPGFGAKRGFRIGNHVVYLSL